MKARDEVAAPATVHDKARQSLPDLTRAEEQVAHALLADYPLVGLETVARFAVRAGTSGPTILRFVNRLGFASYAAFQAALRAEIHTRLQGPLARYPAGPDDERKQDLFQEVGEALSRNIDQAARGISREQFDAAVALLCDENRNIFCIGGRFSWMLASYLHHYLRELRAGARIIRDSSAVWADYLLDVRPGDLVVVFDFRRYQRDIEAFAKGAVRQGASVILVTDIWYSPVSALADCVLVCPVSIPSAFDSGVSGLAVVEMVIAGMVKELGDDARQRIANLEDLRESFSLGHENPDDRRNARKARTTE